MPIINLKIQGKEAIGDGTKIVCMNNDYKVQFTFNDCDTFMAQPVKKLVVRYGKEYQEAIIELNKDGIYEAELPVIEAQSQVELGVSGRKVDDTKEKPIYTSKSATYECVKSVLCGTAVLKEDPTLTTLDVTTNGKYLATDKKADGFYEVTVNVASEAPKLEAERTADVEYKNDDQYGTVITPTIGYVGMQRVVVKVKEPTKTDTIASNGTHDVRELGSVNVQVKPNLQEKKFVYNNGTYTADAGYDGIEEVVVECTGSSNLLPAEEVFI